MHSPVEPEPCRWWCLHPLSGNWTVFLWMVLARRKSSSRWHKDWFPVGGASRWGFLVRSREVVGVGEMLVEGAVFFREIPIVRPVRFLYRSFVRTGRGSRWHVALRRPSS